MRVVSGERVLAETVAGSGRSSASVRQFSIPVTDTAGDVLARLDVFVSTESVASEVARLRWTMAGYSVVFLILGLVAIRVLTDRLTRPLACMVEVAQHIADGDLSQRAQPSSIPDVARLASSFNQMVERLQASQALLENILEGLPAPVALFDADLRCVYHNRAALGWPARPEPEPRDPSLFWERLPASPEALTRMKRGSPTVAGERRTRVHGRDHARPARAHVSLLRQPVRPGESGGRDRVRREHHRAQGRAEGARAQRGTPPAGPEDGGGGAPRRRRGARLQQPAHRHRRQRRPPSHGGGVRPRARRGLRGHRTARPRSPPSSWPSAASRC